MHAYTNIYYILAVVQFILACTLLGVIALVTYGNPFM